MSLNIDYLLLDQRLDASIAALDAALARAGRFPCGPSDENGAASAVTAPAVPSPGVRIPAKSGLNFDALVSRPLKKSNLDLNGRLVKRGCVVSWHGFRGPVARVRGGYLYPVAGSSLFVNVGAWVACESVQVVE